MLVCKSTESFLLWTYEHGDAQTVIALKFVSEPLLFIVSETRGKVSIMTEKCIHLYAHDISVSTQMIVWCRSVTDNRPQKDEFLTKN